MDAARSSPRSSSICTMICSIISFSFCSKFNACSTSWSPSTSLLAAKRTGIPALTAWSSIRCIIAWRHRWTAPLWLFSSQKSCRLGFSWYCATWIAWFISSVIPSFFAAEIGTTGIPSIDSNLLMRTDPPFPRISSIILSASTIGTSSSKSCIVRYRFRSIFVASTIFIMSVGFCLIINSLVTISSLL